LRKFNASYKAGYLTLLDGDVIDYDYIYDYILEIDEEVDLEELVFDKWNARQLINNLDKQTYITGYNYKKVPSSAACNSDCIFALYLDNAIRVATVPSILLAPFSLFGRTFPLGSVIYDYIYDYILEIDEEVDLEELVFDKWNARQLINNLDKQTYIKKNFGKISVLPSKLPTKTKAHKS
jgi:phage terminase large subunit-like protein